MLALGQNSSLRAKQFGSSSSKPATSIKLENPEKSITTFILKYKDWNYYTYQKGPVPQFIHHPPTSIKPLLILVFTLNALGVANYFNQFCFVQPEKRPESFYNCKRGASQRPMWGV